MQGRPTPQLRTERLRLDPLAVADAEEMIDVLADPELYRFTGGRPPSLAELKARYSAQIAGSGGAEEEWHNWILRLSASGAVIGFVQATVLDEVAEVAWTVGGGWQTRSFASEAAIALVAWAKAPLEREELVPVPVSNLVVWRVRRPSEPSTSSTIDATVVR